MLGRPMPGVAPSSTSRSGVISRSVIWRRRCACGAIPARSANWRSPGWGGTSRPSACPITSRPAPNFEAGARELMTRYVGRNGVEDSLGISVDFFHLDCLASEVRLNVDLDVALTVIAHGCYRWLAKRLRGFDKAKPKQLYRRFVETGGTVEVGEEGLVVHFDKRCHNPILKEAGLDRDCPGIPWLRGMPVSFQYP